MNRIQGAFDQIRAEDALKSNTKAFVHEKAHEYTLRRKTRRVRPALACLACLIVFLATGYWLYFTPTVAISIDGTSSIELGINRLERVVSVTGYNEEGQKLTASLDVMFLNYVEAVEQTLSRDNTALHVQEEAVTIAVVGADHAQCERICNRLTEENANLYCYAAEQIEVQDAHELGLSYGKYQAFLELQELDPGTTPEQVRAMSMREVRARIRELSGRGQDDPSAQGVSDSGKNGNGVQNGAGNGKGGANRSETGAQENHQDGNCAQTEDVRGAYRSGNGQENRKAGGAQGVINRQNQ